MKKRKFVFLVAFMLLIVSVCGCGKKKTDSEKMIGKWIVDSSITTTQEFPDNIQFFSNGIGLADEINLQWTAENGTLLLIMSDLSWRNKYTYSYKLKNDKLLLTSDNVTVEYKLNK